MSTCNIGIQNAVEGILNNQPWFKYDKTSGIIEIFDSPNGKINQQNSMGVAKTIATSINKSINDGYKDVGNIAYARFLNNRGAVTIQPTKSQLELINTEDFKKFIELQEQIEDELQEEEFRKLAEESNAFLDEENNQKEDVYFNLNSSPEVQFDFKISNIISGNLAKIKQWESNKSISQELLYNKIQQLGVPKEQLELLKNSDGNTIEEKLTNLIANYSQVIEINTATKDKNVEEGFESIDNRPIPTTYYSNLTVPGGTNGSYIEANIETPMIVPSIQSHAQFKTDNTIGWMRADEKQNYQEKDIDNLIEIMKKSGILEVNCG